MRGYMKVSETKKLAEFRLKSGERRVVFECDAYYVESYDKHGRHLEGNSFVSDSYFGAMEAAGAYGPEVVRTYFNLRK